jgi:ketosteroid isomerase-like protein
MKKNIETLLLSVAMLLCTIPAITIAQDDDAALRKIIEAVRIGWLEADGTPFREHFLDFEGARYFEGGGQNKGLTDLIERHVEPEADAFESFSLDFTNIETHIENGFAWALVDTEIKATVKRDGRVIHNKGRGTYLFRKVGGEWKVVHTNSASRPVKKEEHKH